MKTAVSRLLKTMDTQLKVQGSQKILQEILKACLNQQGLRTQAQDDKLLKDLNSRGKHQQVQQMFERGEVSLTSQNISEYLKALIKRDQLEVSQLVKYIQSGIQTEQNQNGQPSSIQTNSKTSLKGPVATPQYLQSRQYQNQPFDSQQTQQNQQPQPSNPIQGYYQVPQPPYYYSPNAPQQQIPFVGAQNNNQGLQVGTSKNPVHIQQAEPGLATQIWRTIRWLGFAFLLVSASGAMLEDRQMPKSLLNSPDLKPQFNSNTRFDDVKGVDEAKTELQEIVEYLKDPEKFTVLGGKLPKGVLLTGPPGTGKTMLARAVAGEAGAPFFYCSGSEFEEMFVGVGARRVRDLFSTAKQHAPCIVFIDEIDAIGSSRNPRDQQYMKMTLNQLLVELDGFKPSEGVIVIAATNFPESLDKALVRPGRFDRHIDVPNPDVRGRKEILEVHSRKIKLGKDAQLEIIAKGTPGFSGADLGNIINIAAIKAAKDGAKEVNMQALEYARDRVLMGAERKSAVISDQNKKLTAYHEGGHALVALLTNGAMPVHKATIIPRGQSLGMVSQLPDDENSISFQQLMARLDVCMAGRVAEELIFGKNNITTGASSDIQQATRLARAMVERYGFSDKIGKFSINRDEPLSTELKNTIEQEVRNLLNGAYDRAQTLIQTHTKELDAIAKALLENETLTRDQLNEVIKNATTIVTGPQQQQ